MSGIRGNTVGTPISPKKILSNGVVFNDTDHNEAGDLAAAFGEETKALGKAAFAAGAKKTRSGGDENNSSDWLYTEAVGEGSMAAGMGAVAYSRASKSLGYRTQTGRPKDAEMMGSRTEAGAHGFAEENVGQAAVAVGSDTVATENNAFAGGYKSKALDKNAFAFGNDVQSTAPASTALGTQTVASGHSSLADGYNSSATGDFAVALGINSKASGTSAVVIGENCQATNTNSVAIGQNCIAGGGNSVAIGLNNNANKYAATALGYNNTVSSDYGITLGRENVIQGNTAVAIGIGCASAGSASLATGIQTTANAYASATMGRFTVAAHPYQVVMGQSNQYANNAIANELLVVAYGNPNISNGGANVFTVDNQGNAKSRGQLLSVGADYAEMFEWKDGNPEAEDRIGYVVTLDGDKIRLAQFDDDILGVISGTAALVGDSASLNWKDRYLTDEFGRILYDEVEEFVEEEDPETRERIKVSIGFSKYPRINPAYDPESVYTPREERPEWSKVGMMGKLYVRDDGTCVAGGYCAVGADGILTHSETPTNIRVMKRTSENIVWVLMK